MIRLLRIDPATGKDPTGRSADDDWPLVYLGEHGVITTDHLRASDVADLDLPDDPHDTLAAIVAAAGHLARHHREEWHALMLAHHPYGGWVRVEVDGEGWYADRYGVVREGEPRPESRGTYDDLAGDIERALRVWREDARSPADDVLVWRAWAPVLRAADEVVAIRGGTMVIALRAGEPVAYIAAASGHPVLDFARVSTARSSSCPSTP